MRLNNTITEGFVTVTKDAIEIRPFQPRDQSATKQLILAGLVEHWGQLDTTLNPDLDNIASSYLGETFLVAIQNGMVIGCGALIEEAGQKGYGRIVRMSVNKPNRQQGVGQLILQHLETAAQQRQLKKIVLETTQTWNKAIRFYTANGYQIIGQRHGDLHFEKTL